MHLHQLLFGDLLVQFVDEVITDAIGRGKNGRRNLEQHRDTVIDEYLVGQGIYPDNRHKVAVERATDINVGGLIDDLDSLVDTNASESEVVKGIRRVTTLENRVGEDSDVVKDVGRKLAAVIETSQVDDSLHIGLTEQFVD